MSLGSCSQSTSDSWRWPAPPGLGRFSFSEAMKVVADNDDDDDDDSLVGYFRCPRKKCFESRKKRRDGWLGKKLEREGSSEFSNQRMRQYWCFLNSRSMV